MTNVYAEWVSVVHFCNSWWIWFTSAGGRGGSPLDPLPPSLPPLNPLPPLPPPLKQRPGEGGGHASRSMRLLWPNRPRAQLFSVCCMSFCVSRSPRPTSDHGTMQFNPLVLFTRIPPSPRASCACPVCCPFALAVPRPQMSLEEEIAANSQLMAVNTQLKAEVNLKDYEIQQRKATEQKLIKEKESRSKRIKQLEVGHGDVLGTSTAQGTGLCMIERDLRDRGTCRTLKNPSTPLQALTLSQALSHPQYPLPILHLAMTLSISLAPVNVNL